MRTQCFTHILAIQVWIKVKILSRIKKRKSEDGKSPILIKEMLGWGFWLVSPFTRSWHRHRVVLACSSYGWVTHFLTEGLTCRRRLVSWIQCKLLFVNRDEHMFGLVTDVFIDPIFARQELFLETQCHFIMALEYEGIFFVALVAYFSRPSDNSVAKLNLKK